MSVFYTKKMNIVQEAYIGKNAKFKEIELNLTKIIKKINDAEFNKAELKLDSSEENKKVEKLFTEIFDLGGLTIHWTCSAVNAYTRVTSLPYSNKKHLDNFKKTGKVQRSDVSMYVFLDMMLVTLGELNAEEVVAIILHEIGHNLDMSPLYWLGLVLTMIPTGFTGLLLVLTPLIRKVVGNITNAIGTVVPNFLQETVPPLYNFMAAFNSFYFQINSVMGLFSIKEVINRAVSMLNTLRDPGKYLAGYGSERVSDSFSAAYGYGEAQMRALEKLSNLSGSVAYTQVFDMPIINVVADVIHCMMLAVTYLVDPHPTNQTRATNMLNKLKRDLKNNDVPPNLRKELAAQIESFETAYNTEFLNNKSEAEKKVFTYFIKDFNHRLFKDKSLDIREIILTSQYEKFEL